MCFASKPAEQAVSAVCLYNVVHTIRTARWYRASAICFYVALPWIIELNSDGGEATDITRVQRGGGDSDVASLQGTKLGHSAADGNEYNEILGSRQGVLMIRVIAFIPGFW